MRKIDTKNYFYRKKKPGFISFKQAHGRIIIELIQVYNPIKIGNGNKMVRIIKIFKNVLVIFRKDRKTTALFESQFVPEKLTRLS